MDIDDWDFLRDLEELKSAFESGGVEECTHYLESKRDAWTDLPLDVAVIGNSGVGKSSFINTIRGLKDADEEGATDVDVKETTSDIQSYLHPNNPLLKFWDLPGVGTDRFPRQTYLDDIDVDRYDFFCSSRLIASRRTTLGLAMNSANETGNISLYVRRLDKTFQTTREHIQEHTMKRR